LTSAASAHAPAVLRAVATKALKRPSNTQPVPAQVLARVAEHYARGGPIESAGSLLASFANAPRSVTEAVVAGLPRGWPRDRPAKLTEEQGRSIFALLPMLSPGARSSLVGLASRWGSKGLEKHTGEIAATLLATVRDESKGDAARADAARQLVDFRKK